MTLPVHSLRVTTKHSNELSSLTMNQGEVFFDADSVSLRVGDGKTPGGVTLLRSDLTNLSGIFNITVNDNIPNTTKNGTLWFDSANGGLYVYYNGTFVQANTPAFGGGSAGSNYTLPAATTSILGGVIIDGTTITVNNGTISAVGAPNIDGGTSTSSGGGVTVGNYILPVANQSILGGVKVDGNTITINGAGVISTVLTTGSSTVQGTVKVDGTTITALNGTISATQYSLPTASTSILGGVRVDGTTVTINNGVISSTRPATTATTLGEVIIPAVATSGITNTNGTIGLALSSSTQIGGVRVDGTTISSNSGIISTVASNIKAIAASIFTGGTQNGIAYTYDPVSGTVSSLVSGGTSGSGITGLSIQSNSVLQGSPFSTVTLNFTGAGISASVSGSVTTINVPSYSLPIATAGTSVTGTLGGVKVDGTSITIANGVISSTLTQIASTTSLGGVKVDGTSITANASGLISATPYSLPTATSSVLGGVTVPPVINSGINITAGAISIATASSTQLGGVKIDGSTIVINNGVITAINQGGNSYVLPTATVGTSSTGTLGGVKVDGTSILISSGVISTPVNPTFAGTVTMAGNASSLAQILTNTAEVTSIVAASVPSAVSVYVSNQSVIYYTVSALNNFTVDIRHSSSVTLNSVLSVGQSITVALLVTNGGTPYYNTAITIDGTTVGLTTYWQGNLTPVSGHANGIDSYTYTVIKTASTPTYTVLASQTYY